MMNAPGKQSMPQSMQVLQAEHLTIRFGGHVAVNDVSAGFEPGTLTAIVGPNGAGKTTFFNLLSGQLAPTAGRLWFDGEDITRSRAPRRAKMGIGRAFQLTNLFPELSVRENLWLAAASRSGLALAMLRRADSYGEIADRVDAWLARVSLSTRADWPAATLPHGDQRKLEVGMLLALEPRVFMFDEPTAGMSADDVPVILDLIRDISQERDKIVLLVEHKMDVVRSLADRIMVLHEGCLLDEGEPDQVMASKLVRQAYLGEEIVESDDAPPTVQTGRTDRPRR